MMSKDRKPVLIIGAGVVGLVLAHGLKKVRFPSNLIFGALTAHVTIMPLKH